MALYDNKYWLLSHIRNSFISTDDTGMCELIMAGEEGVRKHLKQSLDLYPDDEDSEDEDDLSHESYDLQLDTDFPIRYRSNTAVRLEKMEQVRKKTSRIKHVKWESSPSTLSQEQVFDLFERKEPQLNKGKSLFSKNFKQYGMMPSNPFIQYAKFDGSGHVNMQTKKYRIFLTMLPEHQRNYPINICCTTNAKIGELIGLILLKCSTMYEDYNWKPVNIYGLYITEEDGEVDRDFPCLDPRENIAKFGFSCLGLVEHSDPTKCVSFGNSESITIATSAEFDKRTKGESKSDQEKQISSDLHLMDVHKKSMEAPLYTSYRVYMLNKMRARVEIHLGISGEKIEIDPVQKTSKFMLAKQKPINHDMDMIAWCETVEVKSNRTVFRIFYSQINTQDNVAPSSPTLHTSTSFKSYDFETDHATAEEIVHKISLILELRSGDTRKEYLAAQERKFYKKKGLI